MKSISLEQLEYINGGGEVSETITGVCTAIGILGALKVIAVSGPVGVGIAVGCGVNAVAGIYDWW